MPDFAVITPKLGIAENIPSILMSEAFIARNSVNFHERFGMYERMRGRRPALLDASDVKIKPPTDVFAITDINTGTSTITITGDHSAGNTVLAEGDTFRINGGTTAANNKEFTVSSLPATDKIVTVESLTASGATKGNVFVGTTDVLKYHEHKKQSSGVRYLLIATKYHILLWGESDKSMTVKWTCTTPSGVDRWEIRDHLRNVVATNNSDYVLWWNVDGSLGNSFAALDNADGIDYEGGATRLTKCKHIWSYETYLFLGHTTENGTLYSQRIRWASRGTGGATIDFDENGAGDAGVKDFVDTSGFMMGFAKYGDDLVVSKEDSMYRGWLVSADTVFEWERYKIDVGNVSADSLVNDKAGRLYWVASDLTIREIQTPQSISTGVDRTVRAMNTSKAEYIQGTFINEYNEVWWTMPYGVSDTNNRVIVFSPETGTAFILDTPICAFGDFSQQESYTYGTLPYGTYANWGASWLKYDSHKNVVGFPLDIASDYDGGTFNLHDAETDDDEEMTGTLIFATTLTNNKSLNVFKRVNNGIVVVFNRKSTGSANIYCKRDTEKGWQYLGNASFIDSNMAEVVFVHVPCDMRAKSFEWKIETTGRAEFLGMIFYDFEMEDNR